MSIDLVAAALWLPLEPNRKLVLVSLCENADQKGLCFPGTEYIAARASISARRASAHLHALELSGYARVVRKSRGPKQRTIRLLSVKMILSEGERCRRAFMDRNVVEDDLQADLIPDDSSTIPPSEAPDETSANGSGVRSKPDDSTGIPDDRGEIPDAPRLSNRQIDPPVEPSGDPSHNARETGEFEALTKDALEAEWLAKRGFAMPAIGPPHRRRPAAGARR